MARTTTLKATTPAAATQARHDHRHHVRGGKPPLLEPGGHFDQRSRLQRCLQFRQRAQGQARGMGDTVQGDFDLATQRVHHHSATKFSAPALAMAIS